MEGRSSDQVVPNESKFPDQTDSWPWEVDEWAKQIRSDFWLFPENINAISGGLTESVTEPDQDQLNQAETYQTKSGNGRSKLTPAQKRENKRQSDYRYRQKRKITADEQTAENKHLKEENRMIKEQMGLLLPNEQFSAEAQERQDNYISQSTSKQFEHLSVSVQDQHRTNSGAAERLSGLEINELQNLHQKIPVNVLATNRPTAELLMQKIEANDESNVCFSDFTSIDGERVKVGKYSFPLSLHPVVKRIIAVYVDVSATCKMNLTVAETTYILFCASLKEMGDLQLDQVTEDRILKWRDVIKDALRINFEVDFAMEHLKKIALAYIGRIESQELESMSERISKLEADLNTRREELTKKKELRKKYINATEEFNGRSLSLFP